MSSAAIYTAPAAATSSGSGSLRDDLLKIMQGTTAADVSDQDDSMGEGEDEGEYESMSESEEYEEEDEESETERKPSKPQRPVRIKNNNQPAMAAITKMFSIPSTDFSTNLSHTVSSADIPENAVTDDLAREAAFYAQALETVQYSKPKILALGIPYSRPSDFYAQMVKSDDHMNRIRHALVAEHESIKDSEKARQIRTQKKFSKAVQVEQGLQRSQDKKQLQDNISSLKRKRKHSDRDPNVVDEDFDVQVEDAISSKRPAKRGLSRDGRNQKFGFGAGGDRRSKSNTRESTEQGPKSYSGRGGRGGAGRGGAGAGRGGGSAGRGGRGGSSSARGASSSAPRGAKKRLGKSRRS